MGEDKSFIIKTIICIKGEKIMKKNNKGFSLVELIIVIAIMAILAGAIAPALIRYIDKSRRSNDVKAAKTIDTTMSTALGNEKIYELLVTNGAMITIKPNSTMGTITTGSPATTGNNTIAKATGAYSSITSCPIELNFKTSNAVSAISWDTGVDCEYAAQILYNELSASFSGKTPKINFKKAVKGSDKPNCYMVVISPSGKVTVAVGNESVLEAKSIDDFDGVLDESGAYSILPECCDSYN